MSDLTKNDPTPFIQLASSHGMLYGLDRDGRVWKYIPKNDRRFAFWTRLTDQRAEKEAKGE